MSVDTPPSRPASSSLCRNPLIADEVKTVALGLSKDPNPKTTLLLFWPGCSTPWAAAKLSKTERARQSVRREAAFLRELHERFSGDVLRTIPRRYPDLERGLPDGSMVVEALPGVPLSAVYARARRVGSVTQASRDFDSVERWLRGLQRTTAQGGGRIEFGERVLDSFRARFGSEAMMCRPSRTLERAARTLATKSGPRSVVHGDLWLGNVLIDDGNVTGVIDWESAELTGEPLRDVVRFAITYALYLDRRTKPGRRVRGHNLRAGEWGAGIVYLLVGKGWFPDLVRGFLQRSMARLGADPTAWPALVLVGIAEAAVMADDDQWAYRHLELLDKLRDSV